LNGPSPRGSSFDIIWSRLLQALTVIEGDVVMVLIPAIFAWHLQFIFFLETTFFMFGLA
jgi:hypothetical protein